MVRQTVAMLRVALWALLIAAGRLALAARSRSDDVSGLADESLWFLVPITTAW